MGGVSERDRAIRDLEATAMMVAASDPGDADAAKGMSDAVEAARKAGLSEEEIDKVSNTARRRAKHLRALVGDRGLR